MQTKKLTVLTEGGEVYGFGHITRCLSICKYFKESGIIIEFIIDGDDSILPLVEKQSFVIMKWLNKKSLLKKLYESSFILIDSLRIKNRQIQDIQKLDVSIIYIDDDKRHNLLEKGFILDWTILSDKKNYFLPKKENVTYLLGSKYTPLRGPFNINRRANILPDIESIFVSFGGSDIRNLTPLVLKTLNINFPGMEKTVVIGNGFKNIEHIKSLQDEKTNLIYNADAKKMHSLMISSDIAISSGGQTLYELACVGVPTISILLIENAREDTEGWSEIGSMDYIGNFDDLDLMSKLLTSFKALENQEKRQMMQSNGLKFIGFNGGRLIAEAVIKEAE